MTILRNWKAISAERFRRLSKEGFWIILGQGMAVLGSLVGVRLLTELLEPNLYGELALAMTLAMMVSQTVLGPLVNGVTRFYAPAVEQAAVGTYLLAVRRQLLIGSGIIFCLLILVVTGVVVTGHTALVGVVIASLSFAALGGYNGALTGIHSAARRRFVVAFHQGLEPWLRFAIASGLIIATGPSSAAAISGYCISLILMIGSQYRYLEKNTPAGQHQADIKAWSSQMWQYSWPFASWGIFTWAQQASDRWALGIFTTTNDVGMYAVLFQLGYYPVTLGTGMAVQLLAPVFFQRAGDGQDSQRNAGVSRLGNNLTGLILGLTVIAVLAAQIFHQQVFRLLVAKEYAAVSYLLPLIVLVSGLFAAAQTVALNLMSQMKTASMVWAKTTTAILELVFTFIGAYSYGIRGVVMANVTSSAIYLLWMSQISRRVVSLQNQQSPSKVN